MNFSKLWIGALVLSSGLVLQAAPDISNLDNCIRDVKAANKSPPKVLDFDRYTADYEGLISDLKSCLTQLPHVYQESALKPLLTFLEKLGKEQYLKIFSEDPSDEQSAVLQEMIPDAALSILGYVKTPSEGIVSFSELVSDLYESFLSEENRVSKETGKPIKPPDFGVIPPLVKFGNAEFGPYTWPASDTKILGMGCGIVSLPPAQLKGGLLAWTALGHETGGHDVTHADKGLLEELAQIVKTEVLRKFNSRSLANYWAGCIDETSADILGYLHLGPTAAPGLIGYFRALGDGKLRTYGSTDDPHPIDLLRGYLGAYVVKRLHFKDAAAWSEVIAKETSKDDDSLYLVDAYGNFHRFPVSFSKALASTELVAQVILQSKLKALEGHSLQEIQDWQDKDQEIVNNLVSILKKDGKLPDNLKGPEYYAAYAVASVAELALQKGSNVPKLFTSMQRFLAEMHLKNPTWATSPTDQSLAMLEHGIKANIQ